MITPGASRKERERLAEYLEVGTHMMTPAQLIDFSGLHLHCEIDMLIRVARLTPGLRGQPVYTLDLNVLVESYAIHLRNLIDFLYNPPTGDDVGAVHYVRDVATWKAALGPTPVVLAEARRRAGKQIAHLTEKRYRDGAPEKEWHPEAEIPAITQPLKLFIAYADRNRLHSVVIARVEWLPDLWVGASA